MVNNMAKSNLHSIISFIWSVADDVLRDHYKKGEYPNVILPMTVIRRIDLSLDDTKADVVKAYEDYKDKIINPQGLLESASKKKYYNYSKYTLKTLLNEPKNLKENTLSYLNSYSDNVKDIIEKFELKNIVEKCSRDGILFSLIEKFADPKVAISPTELSNHEMGHVFEDLIRRFNEENNEEAGEHFTPREVIKLMNRIVFDPVKDKIKDIGTILVYDPACGTGGMLSESKEYLKDILKYDGFIHLFGQEVNDKTYATCKADLLIKGEDPDGVAFGSTLSNDGFPDKKFDFMLTNPPYGKTWKDDQKKLLVGDGKKKQIVDSRFQIGIPRVSDGQLLFVEHMLSKMKTDTELGSRIASVHNGSALFTGDAGQGESEIRKYLFENDLIDAIIALHSDMFYNTGIPTYILLITNKKHEKRVGKIQLINATSEEFYTNLKKTLGQKRVEITDAQINKIYEIYTKFENSEFSKIFSNKEFGYTQIKVHQPKKDEKGNIIRKKMGGVEIDKSLEDIENIPLKMDIDTFFNEEVKKYYPDAWYEPDESKIGYEINFNKYFYKFTPPRSSDVILNELRILDKETDSLLKELLKD
ncbi:MAG: class I SAM-dependent DNA methyltransferase [Candidatus Dojkabacteria bacterium]|nr:MAG: class I SAM-dependent DNA methyltransferase [Candidatus Dojkabacteria bacterium]